MASESERITVLHVDDDASFRSLAADVLATTDHDFEITSAASADEALGELRAAPDAFDCIVSDYDMPETTGIEFLESSRAVYPRLPFILFTGKGSEEIASDAISSGVTDYMQKEGGIDQFTVLGNRIKNFVESYRARHRARTTQRRLAEITETSTDCIWMFSADWNDLLFVSGYEAVWERPVSKVRENPRDFLNAIHPDDRARVRNAMTDISDGLSGDIEYRIQTDDGRVKWVWVKGEPVSVGDDVKRVVGFTRDITDRKRHETELEAERRFIEQALNTLPDVFYVIDPDGSIVRWNDQLPVVTGYQSADIDTMNVRDLFPSTVHDRLFESIGTVLDSGSAIIELPLQDIDGNTTPYEFHAGVIADDEAKSRIVGVGRNISERTRRQERISETTALYETVVEQVNDGIRIVKDGEVTFANHRLAEMVGRSTDSLIGEDSTAIIAPESIDRLESHYTERMAGNPAPNQYNLTLQTASGEPLPVEVSVSRIGNEGQYGSLTIFRERTADAKRS